MPCRRLIMLFIFHAKLSCSVYCRLVYSRIQDRDGCQHTSCRACFLLVDPNCEIRCSEPPRKKCLRQYYECIKEHYLHAAARVLLVSCVSLAGKLCVCVCVCLYRGLQVGCPQERANGQWLSIA